MTCVAGDMTVDSEALCVVQFQVKVHDLPGGSGTPGRSSNALKFFDTHQLKVRLPAIITLGIVGLFVLAF